jgi:hypothetical protein
VAEGAGVCRLLVVCAVEAPLRGSGEGALDLTFVEDRVLGWLDLGGGFFGLETLAPVVPGVLLESGFSRSCCPL